MAISPVMITTWNFGAAACDAGWKRLHEGASALDAIETAANITELDPDVGSVGYGGMPNCEGVVELDAAIMDGPTHAAGAVGGLIGIPRAISVARKVMEATPHVMLVGENARRFALRQGFPEEETLTEKARAQWEQWKECQASPEVAHFQQKALTPDQHDTIGLCALDSTGNLAVGCTTSGMAWKIPGRVGDSPIIGSGLYVDNAVGGAAGTGEGDEMMKACVSYRVVMLMEQGRTPQEACEETLRYLLRKRPPEQHRHYGAALIALRKDGLIGAAATKSGFAAPDRLWVWAHNNDGKTILSEGAYVTLDSTVPSLRTGN